MELCKTQDETIDLFKKSIPFLQVLSDPYRQEIIMFLAHGEELQVSEITEMLPLARPTVSHHIKLLKQVGLLGVRREGTRNYYYLTLREVLDMLTCLTGSIEANCEVK